MLILHGDAGALDELIIVVVGFAVLWVAVKLAGRKQAPGGEAEAGADPFEDEVTPPVAPPSH